MDGFSNEPNMSFGKALVVVLVLHVVAVGGIWTFNSLKARKIGTADNSVAHAAKQTTPAPEIKNTPTTTQKPAQAPRPSQDVKPAPKVVPKPVVSETAKPVETPHSKIATDSPKPSTKAVPSVSAKPAASVKSITDSGTVYTVVKGDNPVAIARKFHVKYDDLLKLNKIENPKKLQIGQKLRIPAKSKTE